MVQMVMVLQCSMVGYDEIQSFISELGTDFMALRRRHGILVLRGAMGPGPGWARTLRRARHVGTGQEVALFTMTTSKQASITLAYRTRSSWYNDGTDESERWWLWRLPSSGGRATTHNLSQYGVFSGYPARRTIVS